VRVSRATSSEAEQLALLLEVGREFCSSLQIDEVLRRVLDRVIEVTGAERGFVVLRERDDRLAVRHARNLDQESIEADEFKVSRGLFERVASSGEPLLTSNAMNEPSLSAYESIVIHELRSVMCVPLLVKGISTGVIYVDNRISEGLFVQSDLDLLTAIAQQASIAIDNARRHESTREVVLALANAIEAKDPYTGGHVDRVTILAHRLGVHLGLTAEDLSNLEMAAILHDVGKIGIEESVLTKPGLLNPAERRRMEEHPAIGESIVRGLHNLPESVKLSILHHQERWDGKGYPSGLKGGAIPIYARIVAVSDTFDAMTTTRPYRAALPAQVAIDEITRNSGTQFDPDVVDAFRTVMETWVEPEV